jgi:cytoskeletal protein RodZ
MNTTRSVVGLLASLGIGAVSLALADPPSSTPAASTPAASQTTATAAARSTPTSATSQTTTAATITAPPNSSSDSAEAQEKHFLSEGYTEEMHHGEKMYCRREDTLGSRLGGKKYCSTGEQLNAIETQAQRSMDSSTWQQRQPVGK